MVRGWSEVSLLDCGDLIQGLTYSPSNVVRQGLLVLRSSNIQNGKLAFEDCVFVNCSANEKQYIQQGDILICVRNGSSALIGKSALVKKPMEATFGAFMSVLRSDKSDYLFQVFSSDIIQRQIHGNSSATINQITKSDFSSIRIFLPDDISEQKEIVKALSDADKYIDALEKLIAKKKAVKIGAMQELLTGKRRLKGFTDEWTEQKIEDIAVVGRGWVISNETITKAAFGRYPVYSSQTSNKGIMGFIDTYDFDGEFITWTTDGVNAGAVFYRNGKFNCTNVCGTLKIISGNAKFIASRLGLETPKHVSTNLANPKLMNDVMKKIIITVPPKIAEQTAIAEVLSDVDAEIDALTAKLQKIKAIKIGMMQQLLTGQIRLANTEDYEIAKFRDAIIYAGIVDIWGREPVKFPLGRVKVAKLFYLFTRKTGGDISRFSEHAAGPYDETIRHGGGEPLAVENGYIVVEDRGDSSKFTCGTKINEAKKQLYDYDAIDALKWLADNFRMTTVKELELLATVDNARFKIEMAGGQANQQSIIDYISKSAEWAPKLEKDEFHISHIAAALKQSRELFN